MKRAWQIAIALTAIMLMGVTVASSTAFAATPSVGKLDLQIYYTVNGVQVAVASSSQLTQVNYTNGIHVSQGSGSNPSFSLDYGSYMITEEPQVVDVPHYGVSIANAMSRIVNISSSTTSLVLNVSLSVTHVVSVTVPGIPSTQSAKLSFETPYNFMFYGPTTVNSSASYNISLPSETILATVDYAGTADTFQVSIGSTQNSLTLNTETETGVFGFISSTDGQSISGSSVIVLNTTSGHYIVNSFTGSSYSIYSNYWPSNDLIVTSNGYMPYIDTSVTPGSLNVALTPFNSSVFYNYSVSANMKTLSLNITYKIGPGTSIPLLPNSSVDSLYFQEKLDSVSSSYMTAFLKSQMLRYTNSTIEIDNYSYALNSSPEVHIYNSSFPGNYFNASVSASYYNSTISPASMKNGYQAKIYAFGTSYTSGALKYYYSYAYDNSSLGLSSSTVPVTSYVRDINVTPVSTSQFVYLNFAKVKSPVLYLTQIKLYWKGLNSTDYLLNTSSHPAFVVPYNYPVSFNVSRVLYNPVTSTYNYLPPANFTWRMKSSIIGYGYNFTYSFTSLNNTLNLTGISNTGNSTSSFFTVYAYNGTPVVNYSVSYNSKYYNATNASSSRSIFVPQGNIIDFSAYNSSLVIPGTPFHTSLLFHWAFTNKSFSSPNATYIFSKPSIAVPNQTANLTVTGITGVSVTIEFLVTVNDTTPPTPVISLTNATGVKVSNPVAGSPVNISALKTTDPYFNNTSVFTYKWTFKYPNGTAIPQSSGLYTIVSGNMTNSSSLRVIFDTLNDVIVELNATNPAHVSGYLNRTLTMLVSSPRIVVNSVYIPGKLQEGKSSTIYVNVSNDGTVNAAVFSVTAIINGVVYSHTYVEYLNTTGLYHSRNVSFAFTPRASGNLSVEFMGNNTSEPSFFAKSGAFTTSVVIAPPGYKTPLIIGVIILVIVVIGVVYWRVSARSVKGGGKGQGGIRPKVSLPSDQKKLEKKN